MKKPPKKNRRLSEIDLKSFAKSQISPGYVGQDMAAYP